MDYNTQRNKLILPEYGRCIQEMVEHAVGLDDRNERTRCAYTIIDLMAAMQKDNAGADDFYLKLWNHLALMAGYQLDIDYPVEITRLDEQQAEREPLAYPQQRITMRHYGASVEKLAHHLMEMEEGDDKQQLIVLVANQMKRELAKWNSNALSDEKIFEDLASFTEGKISLMPGDVKLITDKQALADAQQQQMGKKKKKK